MATERCGYDYPHQPHQNLTGLKSRPRCPGVRPDPTSSDRRKAPVKHRTMVLTILRDVKTNLSYLVGRWDVGATVYHGNMDRPRRYSEYPEQSAAYWRELAVLCKNLANRLNQLADSANHQANALTGDVKREALSEHREAAMTERR